MDRLARILSCDHGFTFIEVSISIVVLSLALLAMAGMQIIALRGNSFANQISTGGAIAEDIVEKLMVLDYNALAFEDLTPVGTFTPHHELNPPPGYTILWKVDTDAPMPLTKTVNVDITWNTALGDKNFSLSFVKVGP